MYCPVWWPLTTCGHLNLNKLKTFGFSVALLTLQVFNTHTQLMVTIVESTDAKSFHLCRNFWWKVLAYYIFQQLEIVLENQVTCYWIPNIPRWFFPIFWFPIYFGEKIVMILMFGEADEWVWNKWMIEIFLQHHFFLSALFQIRVFFFFFN